jgi:hypothetical protein
MLIEAEASEPSRCSEMLLKKPRILAIGLPGKVKSVTHEGNTTEPKIHPDIPHPSKRMGEALSQESGTAHP